MTATQPSSWMYKKSTTRSTKNIQLKLDLTILLHHQVFDLIGSVHPISGLFSLHKITLAMKAIWYLLSISLPYMLLLPRHLCGRFFHGETLCFPHTEYLACQLSQDDAHGLFPLYDVCYYRTPSPLGCNIIASVWTKIHTHKVEKKNRYIP